MEDSKILLILAGGTICMQSSEQGYVPTKGLLGKCLAGHSAFDDGSHPPVLDIIDEKNVRRPGDASLRLPSTDPSSPSIHYTAFEFASLIDSSAADTPYWALIARCIAANYSLFNGFVVLHGTDTLAYAASTLSFYLDPLYKPVILTGSQVSIFDTPSDAWDNIHGSLLIAGDTSNPIPEVALYFHRTLLRGNRSTKIHASEYAAFASPNLSPLAKITPQTNKIIYTSPYPSPPPHYHSHTIPCPLPPLNPIISSSSSSSSSQNNPSIHLLRIFPSFPPTLLTTLLTSTPSLRGLILETFGAGNMPSPPSLLATLSSAINDRGVVIVNISQCLNGKVSSFYAPAKKLEGVGVVLGGDMSAEAGFGKLGYLVGREEERLRREGGPEWGRESMERVRVLMSADLRGEVTVEARREVEAVHGGEKRRNSLVVPSLGWSEYVPFVRGLPAGEEHGSEGVVVEDGEE